ncbi:MAG: hypothetical protein JXN10_12035 [Clostridia bacterium]|nr:hypothetical protein [Clostridia bacterium]
MMFTDIHCHIIPGVDDGPETMEESLSMLLRAKQRNIETVFATPHCFLTSPLNEYELKKKIEELNEKKEADISIELGCEMMIEDTLPRFVEQNKWVCLGNSKNILVELPIFNYPIYVKQVLFDLNQRGYRPIIAHPERYVFAQKDMDRFLDEIDDYADFQLNAGSLNGYYGRKAKKAARELIKRGKATYIASDAHNIKAYNHLQEAYDTYRKLRGKEEADKVFFYNPLLVAEQ